MTGKRLCDPQDREVYFLKPVGFEGPIKIGSAICAEFRRGSIEPISPFRLEIMLVIPEGGLELEQRLHRRFAYAHSHCEWFDAVPDLLFGIEQTLIGVPPQKAFHLEIETGSLTDIRKRQTQINREARDQYHARWRSSLVRAA